MINCDIKDLLVGPLKDLLDRSRSFAELVDEAEFKHQPAKLYLTCSARHQLLRQLKAMGAGLRQNLSFFKTEYVDLLTKLVKGVGFKAFEWYELLVDKVGDSDRQVGPKAAKYVTLSIMFQSRSFLGLVQRIQFRIARRCPRLSWPTWRAWPTLTSARLRKSTRSSKSLKCFRSRASAHWRL